MSETITIRKNVVKKLTEEYEKIHQKYKKIYDIKPAEAIIAFHACMADSYLRWRVMNALQPTLAHTFGEANE